jgi:hypothetical protein
MNPNRNPSQSFHRSTWIPTLPANTNGLDSRPLGRSVQCSCPLCSSVLDKSSAQGSSPLGSSVLEKSSVQGSSPLGSSPLGISSLGIL